MNLFGAPFASKTTNIPVRGLFTGNDGLQYVAAAYDSDRRIVDLDGINDRTDIQPPLGTVVEATAFNRLAAARLYSAGRVEASDPDLIMKRLATSERTATRR